MVIRPSPELELALNRQAEQRGIAPEVLAIDALKERFLVPTPPLNGDEWERGLRAAARDCGVSLPNSAFSSEELYD